MTADEVSYDRETEIAVAVGQIALREPGALMRGESVTYDAKTRVASISNAMFVLHEAHMAGAAGSLLRDGDGDIQVKDGAVTFCAPDDPSWTLHTRRLELAPEEGIGEAHDAVLQIAGVPVMYLPWLQFPIDERRKPASLPRPW